MSRIAGADPVTEDRARALFREGKAAFSRRDFQAAYDDFKRAYVVSSEPAFLFNVASAQQELGRGKEAAETLRAYLRVRPADSDRPLIEERIRALDEKQRLLDEAASPRPLVAAPSPLVASAAAVAKAKSPALVQVVAPRPRPTPLYQKWWLWTPVSVVAVGVALGVGLGVGLSQPHAYSLVTF